MLKIGELKQGDIVKVNDDGVERVGTVVRVSVEERQALINNGVQEFWYSPEDIHAIPLDEQHLEMLGFEKQPLNGGMKYLKGTLSSSLHHRQQIPVVLIRYIL